MTVPLLDLNEPADWRAGFACTLGGGTGYGRFNLGMHVGDDPQQVAARRSRLAAALGVTRIAWLNQVHGVECLEIGAPQEPPPDADAVWTRARGLALGILTADCVPVLLAGGGCVAAAHAGWRGIAGGILPRLVRRLPAKPRDLRAFIGPAISGAVYQVGEEVAEALRAVDLEHCLRAQRPDGTDRRYLADLIGAARAQLAASGVSQVSGGDWCTLTDERFYSYRRASIALAGAPPAGGPAVGRQASLVWLRGT
ncbi:MAG: peptidoglycan editing factor PgeF [Pseudomonadota bacterium]